MSNGKTRRLGWMLLGALFLFGSVACTNEENGEENLAPCPGEAERNPITGQCTTKEAPDTDIREYDGGTTDSGTMDVADGADPGTDGGGDATTDGGEGDGGDTSDAGETNDGGSTDDATTVDASGAILEGTVSRAEDTTVEENGVGNLYIALTPDDPRTNPDTEPTAFDLVEDADLSDPSNSVEYQLTGIPPRSEDYYLSAFLDDDGDASGGPSEAGPDQDDLMNLTDSFGVPTITISEEKTYEHDIVLTTGLPISP